MVPLPRQLPPVPANFTGRSEEIAELERLATRSDTERRPTIVVIMGAGGLGKTALAASWLHGISDQFEGGALFSDLRGHLLGTAARPGDVAASFLRAFGVAPEHIPVEPGDQAALFRTVTTGRRVLVLLDNAASAAQVRMLLPGPGPGPGTGPSLVVVTTRWRITGLVVDGANFLELDPLDESASLRLFDRIVGTERAAAEPEDRRTVVRLCGGIALALSVTAARLAAHPHWPVSRVAADLSDDRRRLTALSLTDDLSVRAAFDTSYRTLPPAVARAYRMSAMIPGPDFGAGLAASVLDDDEGHARSLLDTLADASLLTETGSDRYRYHDLARLHARECADSGPATERHAAIARAVAWYLDRAVAADLVVSPLRWHLNPMYERAALEQPAYASSADALDWLETQLPGLLAAVRAAHDAGLHEQAWQLCEALWGVFLFRKHFQHWISSHLIGLASAQACDDPRAEARVRVQLGTAFRNLGRAQEARQEFVTALSLDRRASHPVGEATALEQIALVDMSHHHLDEAIQGFTEAQAIHQRAGVPRGVAMTTRHIGEAHREAERYIDALRFLAEARRLFATLPDPYMEARTLTSLAQTYLLAGRPQDAVGPLTGALAIMTRLGSRYEQARIERYLGIAAIQLGDLPTARRHVRLAVAGFEQAGAPEAEEVRHQLAALGEEGDTRPASE
jgi:tetratricopeptide (TPR) repeat protein